ncbi:unnamed protein product [Microthlaspi erraticum]|uniref:Polygalacturonase n=1 Tax=Microthlaspi erraticum TaxID=1685480 RepID=A0A6D2HFW1_9BRAS|nr:unnamed protein product [Microthlaspi erraticum]
MGHKEHGGTWHMEAAQLDTQRKKGEAILKTSSTVLLDQPVEFLNSTGQASTRSSCQNEHLLLDPIFLDRVAPSSSCLVSPPYWFRPSLSSSSSWCHHLIGLEQDCSKSTFPRLEGFVLIRGITTGVTVTAPGDSPNTDGIKFGFCSNIRISNTNIGTGYDCIAILSGTSNMDISNVKCGPGHGISVGSLGKNKGEKDVIGITVRDTVFNSTSDGIRIKTWESSAAKIVASKFVFENIQMINIGKPINIDQKYCPYPPCEKTGASHVQIKDIKYKNIYGTSKNKVAVNLQCSKSFRCKNVELIDINLEHNGVEGGPSTAVCENVDGSARGKMVPKHCLA